MLTDNKPQNKLINKQMKYYIRLICCLYYFRCLVIYMYNIYMVLVCVYIYNYILQRF